MNLGILSQPDSKAPSMIIFLIFFQKDVLNKFKFLFVVGSKLRKEPFMFPNLESFDFGAERDIYKLILGC